MSPHAAQHEPAPSVPSSYRDRRAPREKASGLEMSATGQSAKIAVGALQIPEVSVSGGHPVKWW